MRKSTIAILMLILLCISTMLLCSCDDMTFQKELANQCIRIHIRANSNDESDQAIKLEVRDKITAYLQSRLASCKSKAQAKNVLEQEQDALAQIADSVLYNANFNYKTTVCLKNEYFPERQYDGYCFPEGYYDALIVYLGEGVGDNWWCVAFPPLCFVPNSNNGENIVYKSWVKEWLDKTFRAK